MTEENKKEETKKEEAEKEETKKEEQQPSGSEEEKEEKEEKEEEEISIPENLKQIVESIEKLSVLDLAELVKVLEKKFGVSASPAAIIAPATSSEKTGGVGGGAEEGKTEFNVVLTSVGDKKIEVIKAVRDVTEKGLKEAKDLVDAVASGPQVIKESVKKEEAEEIKKKFETAGAKVELK